MTSWLDKLSLVKWFEERLEARVRSQLDKRNLSSSMLSVGFTYSNVLPHTWQPNATFLSNNLCEHINRSTRGCDWVNSLCSNASTYTRLLQIYDVLATEIFGIPIFPIYEISVWSLSFNYCLESQNIWGARCRWGQGPCTATRALVIARPTPGHKMEWA